VTGPQEVASVSLCAGFRSQVLGPGEPVWLRTRANFDPKLNLNLNRPAGSLQGAHAGRRAVLDTGAEGGQRRSSYLRRPKQTAPMTRRDGGPPQSR
jgi:hypothetical protein